MSTHSAQFFMTAKEFESLLWEVAGSLKLAVILLRYGPPPHLEIANRTRGIKMANDKPADQLFLSEKGPDMAVIKPTNLCPGKLGWVQLDIPRESNNKLYLSRIAVKSDWFDNEKRKVVENSAVLNFYKKIISPFKKHLSYPIWAWDVRVDVSREYRNIGYSKGTKVWERKGGKLYQEGVKNVRFSVKKPTEKRSK